MINKVMKNYLKKILKINLLIIIINSPCLGNENLTGFDRLAFSNITSPNSYSSFTVELIGFKNTFDKKHSDLEKAVVIIGEDTLILEVGKVQGEILLLSIQNNQANLKVGEKIILLSIGQRKKIKIQKQIKSNIKQNDARIRKKISNEELIQIKNNEEKDRALKYLNEISITNNEKKLLSSFIQEPSRSRVGRLGWKINKDVNNFLLAKFSLKYGDLILTVNNIPVNNYPEILKLYQNKKIKKIILEIERNSKLIAVEINI